MDIEKLIEQLSARGLSNGSSLGYHSGLFDEAATALSTLQAENEKLRERIEDARLEGYAKGLGEMSEENEKLLAELEQVTLENNALWTYIKIVDREYRRYMDRGYIDRLDELKRTWRRGQKED